MSGGREGNERAGSLGRFVRDGRAGWGCFARGAWAAYRDRMKRSVPIAALAVAGATLGCLALIDCVDYQTFLWSLIFL